MIVPKEVYVLYNKDQKEQMESGKKKAKIAD